MFLFFRQGDEEDGVGQVPYDEEDDDEDDEVRLILRVCGIQRSQPELREIALHEMVHVVLKIDRM